MERLNLGLKSNKTKHVLVFSWGKKKLSKEHTVKCPYTRLLVPPTGPQHWPADGALRHV